MDIEYMRTAKKSYMIVRKADFPFEPFELQMILQNKIPCLLPFRTILRDGAAEYWYEVSGMQSLATRFSLENLTGRQIRLLLEGLLEMKSAMEEYLLDDANICFSAGMVYCAHSGERLCFCYIPGLAGQGSGEPGTQAALAQQALFEEILQHLDHTDPAAVRMGYEMYERAARAPFSAQDCLDCLALGEDLPEREAADMPADCSDAAQEEMEFLPAETEQKAGHRKKRRKEGNAPRAGRDRAAAERQWEFGGERGRQRRAQRARAREQREEDEMLFALRPSLPECPGDAGRTEVICAGDEGKAWELVYKGDGLESDLALTGFPFLVGTDSRRVNGVLRARTVSHLHAKLFLEEDRLFVEDFNSTNGTYLNHTLLAMNTPAEVKEGDRIVFATEEYAVYCRRTGS